MLDREPINIRDVMEISKISDINLITRALNEYERIRNGCYGKNNIGIDAAIGEVLKILGLED